jgi:hypothetical protein
MNSMGFAQCRSDPCLFVKHVGDLQLCVIRVDNGLLATNTKEQADEFIAKLGETFRLTDLGEPKKFLGMIVERTEERIKLYQESKILEMLNQFNLEEAKSASTPAISGEYLTSKDSPVTESEKKKMENVPYRALVGTELYICNATHPETAKAIGECCSQCSNPGENHWTAAKRLARYLKFAKNKGIVCQAQKNGEDLKLLGYADANYGGDTETRKSQTGWVFLLNGTPVSFSSKRQQVVATSTAEAEYVAYAHAAQQAVHLKQLLEEILRKKMEPVEIFVDNQSARQIANTPMQTERTKHIDIKHHAIREYIKQGWVTLTWCPSAENLADLLTKNVNASVFKSHVDKLVKE